MLENVGAFLKEGESVLCYGCHNIFFGLMYIMVRILELIFIFSLSSYSVLDIW